MAQQTSMQELQNELELLWSKTDVITIESILDFIRDKGIPKEKNQICDSYVEGLEGLYMGAEEYYEKTYNQNK